MKHWPKTWNNINKYLHPFAKLEDEGDALVEIKGKSFVLESHESGIEIITFASSFFKLVTDIITLIVTIIKGYSQEIEPSKINLNISKSISDKDSNIIKTSSISIEIPLSKEQIDNLTKTITDYMNKDF